MTLETELDWAQRYALIIRNARVILLHCLLAGDEARAFRAAKILRYLTHRLKRDHPLLVRQGPLFLPSAN